MLTALVIASLVLGTAPGATTSSACDLATLQVLGYCPDPDNTGTDVVIDGTQETDGGPGTDGTSDSTNDEWQPPSDDGTVENPFDFEKCLNNFDSNVSCFRPNEHTDDDEDEEDTPDTPSVTITDLVRFAPEGSVVTGEPGNVGVADLPTNFVAVASVQTVTGELFGFPISVRFTPSAYDFTFGDGSASTTSTGGSTWEALGQAQFTPTDTSHAYRDRGTYTAQVDVRYTAEVDFGVGWTPISGQVTASGPPQEIRIFEAHTALVAFTCAQAPASPGC